MFEVNEKWNEKWNDRLDKSGLSISSIPLSTSNGIKLSIFRKQTEFNQFTNFEKIGNIRIDFIFTYSVAKRTLKRFDNICEQLLENEYFFIIDSKDIRYKLKKEDISLPIFEESDLKIYKTDYINRKLVFKNKTLTEIILIVSLIEKTIEIISKLFSYDDENNELSKIKFPVGTVVSIKGDETNDFIVQKIDFINLTYKLSKIVFPSETKEVFILENVGYFNESLITQNRDYKLGQILD
jgi:hypothetical protein